MKSHRLVPKVISAMVCVAALVFAVGCSSASAPAPASSSAASTAASTAASDSSKGAALSSASSAASTQQSTSSTSGTMTADEAAAQGYQVFMGTLRVVSAEQLIALQGKNIDPSSVSNGGTYAVLVFDQPTKVTGMYADGSGEQTREANMLGVAEHTQYSSNVVDFGNLDSWKSYDGKKISVAAKSKDITFPSDVRLPLNEPTASTSIVLS